MPACRYYATVLADAGFDLVHELDTAICAHDPELAVLADPARRRGLLIGNTRALWPRFLAAYRADPTLAADPDPLDRYTERTIAAAFPGEPTYFVHATYGDAWLPFQRLAELAGMAYLAPTHLSIHPTYGPWFALRAIVLLHGAPPTQHASVARPCRCADACTSALASAMSSKDPESWIAVRDACAIGREHRYPEDQLRYHYTKDRSLLR